MPAESQEQLVETLGPDLVYRDGERIIVETPARRLDWEVRDFHRVEVRYRGRIYYIAGQEKAPRKRTRWLLEPWPDDDEPMAYAIDYGPRYVEAGEKLRRVRIAEHGANLLLVPFEPLLGLLPGRTLLFLADHYGVGAERAQGLSIFMEIVVAAIGLVALRILPAVEEVRDHLGWILLATVVLFVDGAMRYHKRLAEDHHPYGFLEWILPRPKQRGE